MEREAVAACGLLELGVILHRRRCLEKRRHRGKGSLAMIASWAVSVCEGDGGHGRRQVFSQLCDN